MQNIIKNGTKFNHICFIYLLFLIFPFLKGMHDTLVVVITSVIMLIFIYLKAKKNNKLIYSTDSNFIIIFLWCISYLVASFYAVDKGMALLGALKMLSIPIFILLYFQYEKLSKEKIFDMITYSGVCMVIVSLLASLIPVFTEKIFSLNRLQGFFFYANTFGLWLLIGLISAVYKESYNKSSIFIILILCIGIVLTNSRSIIILSIIGIAVSTFFSKHPSKRKMLYIMICIISIILSIIFLKVFNIDLRIKNLFTASEFTVRLYYYEDAINLILRYPFGLGHQGWWNIQNEIQIATYNCEYVHNSLLQICLDVGIVPCILLIFLAIKTLFDKNVSSKEKIILSIILLHSMIDFDFEFLSIIYVIVLIPKYRTTSTTNNFYKYVLFFNTVIYAYFSIVLLSFELNNYKFAYTLYPNYTNALIAQMLVTNDIYEQEELATRAIKLNNYAVQPYAILFELKNTTKDIPYAYTLVKRILDLNKYSAPAYTKYLNFLESTMYYYDSINDAENVKIYMERIIETENYTNNILHNIQEKSFLTKLSPQTYELPSDLIGFVHEVKEYYYSVYN